MAEPVIDREEAVALLFNVVDIAATMKDVYELLLPEDDGEEEVDEG
jgi:hypothetical protein